MNDVTKYIDHAYFEAGDFLFKEGEISNFVYVIDTGKVEVFQTDEEGGYIPLAVLGSGQAIGEFALITKQPRSASVRAITDVKVARISEEGYKRLLDGLPDWAQALIESLVDRLKNADKIIKNHKIVEQSIIADIDKIKRGLGED